MHWTDRRAAKAKLAEALLELDEWKVYGYREDESDSMTDYYDPAYWSPGVAVHESGLILTVDTHEYDVNTYAGRKITKSTRRPGATCPDCNGTGDDASGWTLADARAEPERYHRETARPGCVSLLPHVVSPIPFKDFGGHLKCRTCHGPGHDWIIDTEVIDHYPDFKACPPRSLWALWRGSEVVAKGVGLEPCSRYGNEGEEAVQKLLDRWHRHTAKVAVAAGVLAVDEHLQTSAIYGIGTTGLEARDDGRRGGGPDAEFAYVPATQRLLDAVKRDGGGPGDVAWDLVEGSPAHLGTDPSDVTAHALADLATP